MTITRVNFDRDNPTEGYEQESSRNSDAPDVRGVYLQNDSSNDTSVLITRDGSDNLTLQDPTSGTVVLSTLISSLQHETLRQLIHLADGVGGPMEGWPTGSYRETLPTGNPFPTSLIWWTDSGKTKKIVSKLITFSPSKLPTTVVYAVYQSDGVTVIATVTDTITYSGVFETSRTRAVT